MEARSCDADHVFRVYTACPQDIATILLDVRAQKEFKQLHLFNAFCVRLSSNGKVLAVSKAVAEFEVALLHWSHTLPVHNVQDKQAGQLFAATHLNWCILALFPH